MKRQNLRTVSLVVVTFTYLLIGAAIFGFLESEHELRQRESLEFIERIIRGKYNISDDDYTVLTTTVIKSVPHKAGIQWKFPGAFYFATTVVTTIGYGHSTPSTVYGRSFCMAYALIGIPLGLVMFQSIGERLNTFVGAALRWAKRCFKSKNPEVTVTNLVMVVSVLSTILMTSMAAVFAKYERWDYFDALYYCFITLTTIGFGDYVALQKESALQSKPEYVILSLVFILFGLSVVSSAVNLLVLKFLTLNTEDERRDEQLRNTAAMNPIQLEGDVITSSAGKLEYVGPRRQPPALTMSQAMARSSIKRDREALLAASWQAPPGTTKRRSFRDKQKQLQLQQQQQVIAHLKPSAPHSPKAPRTPPGAMQLGRADAIVESKFATPSGAGSLNASSPPTGDNDSELTRVASASQELLRRRKLTRRRNCEADDCQTGSPVSRTPGDGPDWREPASFSGSSLDKRNNSNNITITNNNNNNNNDGDADDGDDVHNIDSDLSDFDDDNERHHERGCLQQIHSQQHNRHLLDAEMSGYYLHLEEDGTTNVCPHCRAHDEDEDEDDDDDNDDDDDDDDAEIELQMWPPTEVAEALPAARCGPRAARSVGGHAHRSQPGSLTQGKNETATTTTSTRDLDSLSMGGWDGFAPAHQRRAGGKPVFMSSSPSPSSSTSLVAKQLPPDEDADHLRPAVFSNDQVAAASASDTDSPRAGGQRSDQQHQQHQHHRHRYQARRTRSWRPYGGEEELEHNCSCDEDNADAARRLGACPAKHCHGHHTKCQNHHHDHHHHNRHHQHGNQHQQMSRRLRDHQHQHQHRHQIRASPSRRHRREVIRHGLPSSVSASALGVFHPQPQPQPLPQPQRRPTGQMIDRMNGGGGQQRGRSALEGAAGGASQVGSGDNVDAGAAAPATNQSSCSCSWISLGQLASGDGDGDNREPASACMAGATDIGIREPSQANFSTPTNPEPAPSPSSCCFVQHTESPQSQSTRSHDGADLTGARQWTPRPFSIADGGRTAINQTEPGRDVAPVLYQPVAVDGRGSELQDVAPTSGCGNAASCGVISPRSVVGTSAAAAAAVAGAVRRAASTCASENHDQHHGQRDYASGPQIQVRASGLHHTPAACKERNCGQNIAARDFTVGSESRTPPSEKRICQCDTAADTRDAGSMAPQRRLQPVTLMSRKSTTGPPFDRAKSSSSLNQHYRHNRHNRHNHHNHRHHQQQQHPRQHLVVAATAKLVCKCCCQHAECIEYAFGSANRLAQLPTSAASVDQDSSLDAAGRRKTLTNQEEGAPSQAPTLQANCDKTRDAGGDAGCSGAPLTPAHAAQVSGPNSEPAPGQAGSSRPPATTALQVSSSTTSAKEQNNNHLDNELLRGP